MSDLKRSAKKTMTAHQADIIYTSLAFILPIAAVALIRKGWIAIPLAAFAHWATLDAAGRILQQLDPERDSGIFDALWAALGWIQALILVTILWKTKQFIIRLKNRKKDAEPGATDNDHGCHGSCSEQHAPRQP